MRKPADISKENLAVKSLSRREALRRIGLGAAVAYAAPSVLRLSEARAASAASRPSKASKPSDASPPTTPTPPTPPSPPSNVDEIERDETPADRCQGTIRSDGAITLSSRDNAKAAASVEAGYAKPLNEIWASIAAQYPGRIVGITFTGYRWRPRYRLRAISPNGRLETVIVSARTGQVERIVGC